MRVGVVILLDADGRALHVVVEIPRVLLHGYQTHEHPERQWYRCKPDGLDPLHDCQRRRLSKYITVLYEEDLEVQLEKQVTW